MWELIVSVPDHCLSFYFVHLTHAKRFQVLTPQQGEVGLIFVFRFSLFAFRFSFFAFRFSFFAFRFSIFELSRKIVF